MNFQKGTTSTEAVNVRSYHSEDKTLDDQDTGAPTLNVIIPIKNCYQFVIGAMIVI